MIRLIILSLFFHVSIHAYPFRNENADSCKIEFISNLISKYDSSNVYIKANMDSCGKRWEELVPSKILYNYYVGKIHLPFKTYSRIVVDILINGQTFDRCSDDEIKGVRLDSSFYYRLNHLPPKKVIKKYFNSKGLLKKKWIVYKNEFYAYFYDKFTYLDLDTNKLHFPTSKSCIAF